jgi:DNA-binding transcriptional ArsR family regulator
VLDEKQRSVDDLRELRDPRSIRALAHPIRLDLLEALAVEGPLTATQAAELIGETPTTCSFHLRQLQKYGFVEDSGRRGTRERPWRLTQVGTNIPEATGDTEMDMAAGALTRVFLDRYLARVRAAYEERHSYSKEWRDATSFTEMVFFVTVEELDEIRRDMEAIMFRYLDRIEDPAKRPPGAAAVESLFFSYLMRAPGPTAGGKD